MIPLHLANLAEIDRAALWAAAKAIHGACPCAVRIVLFGSRARGEPAPDSDMDLLVLTARPLLRDERHTITAVLSPLGRELGIMFSTLVVDEQAWTGGPHSVLPIHTEIERDGIAA